MNKSFLDLVAIVDWVLVALIGVVINYFDDESEYSYI